MQGDAFSSEECAAIRDWVTNGGSQLLVTDYAPTAKKADLLAKEFGVKLRDGYAVEPNWHDQATRKWGFVVFSREDGLLVDHPITRGRTNSEALNKVVTFSGQGMDYPANAIPFLKLSNEAREYPYHEKMSGDDEYRSGAGSAEGVAFEFGRGRVVMLGDAAVLTSQVTHVAGKDITYGMAYTGSDDRQLALNIMHWLMRALN